MDPKLADPPHLQARSRAWLHVAVPLTLAVLIIALLAALPGLVVSVGQDASGTPLAPVDWLVDACGTMTAVAIVLGMYLVFFPVATAALTGALLYAGVSSTVLAILRLGDPERRSQGIAPAAVALTLAAGVVWLGWRVLTRPVPGLAEVVAITVYGDDPPRLVMVDVDAHDAGDIDLDVVTSAWSANVRAMQVTAGRTRLPLVPLAGDGHTAGVVAHTRSAGGETERTLGDDVITRRAAPTPLEPAYRITAGPAAGLELDQSLARLPFGACRDLLFDGAEQVTVDFDAHVDGSVTVWTRADGSAAQRCVVTVMRSLKMEPQPSEPARMGNQTIVELSR